MRVRLALPALLAGCAATAPPAAPPGVLAPSLVEESVMGVLAAALDADRRLARADTLWDGDAVAVADGTLRDASPRFAAVDSGGAVAITSSRLEVRQTLVWVFFDYRWISMKDGVAREAKATVLLVPKGPSGGWKIVHAHSSTTP